MPNRRVVVKYQFYEVCCMDGDAETENLYDLSSWANRLRNVSLVDRLKTTNGIKGRLEDVSMVRMDQFEAYNFMRLDELSNTYKVKVGDVAEHIDLEDDEYIGKNTVVLYDPRFHVAMVQCNRGSYGVGGIVSYINSFNNDLCYFRPVLNEYIEELYGENVTKLDIRFANTRQFIPRNSRQLERIIESCNEMEALTAHIEIGLGYTRGRNLNRETISDAVTDIRSRHNKGCIKSAKIVVNDDTRSAVFDLFDNIDYENIYYTVPPRGELAFGFMADTMAERYDNVSRARIHNILRNRE